MSSMTPHQKRSEAAKRQTLAPPHPTRVTATGSAHVTGIQPMCPHCPLIEGHEGPHMTQADVEGTYILDRTWPNGYRPA